MHTGWYAGVSTAGGGECVDVEGRRSRRCTESVVASCVSVADQNIGINKPKLPTTPRQDKARQLEVPG